MQSSYTAILQTSNKSATHMAIALTYEWHCQGNQHSGGFSRNTQQRFTLAGTRRVRNNILLGAGNQLDKGRVNKSR